MLKGIDPILGPELLSYLRAMGHGDEIVVADANFPATTNARRLVRADGLLAPPVIAAILSLLPLDDFVPHAAFRMAVTDDPTSVPPVCREFAAILLRADYRREIAAIERMAFYARARDAYAIVATGETRLWGNLILRKGVVRPETSP